MEDVERNEFVRVEHQLRGVQHVFKVRLETEDQVHEIVNEMRRRLNEDENVHEEDDIVNDVVNGNEIEEEDIVNDVVNGNEIEVEDENHANESEEEPEDVD